MVKKFLMVAAVVASLVASGATETVNGIKWTYTVSNGKASVGDGKPTAGVGSSRTPAISNTTSGEIIIPSSLGGYPVSSIGEHAFYGCSKLTSVTIPSSVVSIGWQAFSGCRGLMSVKILDLSAWCGISFGDNPLYYAHHLYLNDKEITDLVIPSGVRNVANQAFWYCNGLTSVVISDGVTSIGSSAFSNCSGLASVVIPSSVTNIAGHAFDACDGLMEISVDTGNMLYSSESGILYDKGKTTLIQCPRAKDGIVKISSSVTRIGEWAFDGCDKLSSVIIPEGVISIDHYAFRDCTHLTSPDLPPSLTNIGDYAFEHCTRLTSIIVPDGVHRIGQHTFYGCEGLSSVSLPQSLTVIDCQAFENCSGLTSVAIPPGVKTIRDAAFQGCRGLTSIIIPEGVERIHWLAFSNCSNLESVVIPTSVTSIGQDAFSGTALIDNAKDGLIVVNGWVLGVKGRYSPALEISNGIKGIADSAFLNCDNLMSVTIPPSVMHIGRDAFQGCIGLGEGLVCVDDCLFRTDYLDFGPESEAEIVIPRNVRLIAAGTFAGTMGLKSVVIPMGITEIGEGTFEMCDQLETVTIPSSVTNIGANAFMGCKELKSLVLSNGVRSIGEHAFEACRLETITIPPSVTHIGEMAIGVYELKTVYVAIGDEERMRALFEETVLLDSERLSDLDFVEIELSTEDPPVPPDTLQVNIRIEGSEVDEDAVWVSIDGEMVQLHGRYEIVGHGILPKELRWRILYAESPYSLRWSVIEADDWDVAENGSWNCRFKWDGRDAYFKIQVVDAEFGLDCRSANLAIFCRQPDQETESVEDWVHASCYELTIGDKLRINYDWLALLGCEDESECSRPMLLIYRDWDDLCEVIPLNKPSGYYDWEPQELGDYWICLSDVSDLAEDIWGYGFEVIVEEPKPDGKYTTLNDPEWTYVVSDGYVTIYNGRSAAVRRLRPSTSEVIVPVKLGGRPVIGIGRWAFHSCSWLSKVTIHSNIVSIEADAFNGCNSLKTVYVDSGDLDRVRGMMSDSGFNVTDVLFIELGGLVSHTVTFDLGEHGTRTGGGELVQTVTNGCAAVAPEVEADDWWRFVGWGPEDLVFEDALEARYWWEQVGQNGGWQVPLDGIKRDTTVRAIYRPLLPWQDDIQLSLAIDEEKSHFDCEEGRLQLYVTWSLSGADAPKTLPGGTRVLIQEARTLRDEWWNLEGVAPMGDTNEIVFDVDTRFESKAYFRAVIDWPYGGDFISANIYAFDATIPDHIDYEYDGWWQEEGVLVVHPGETVKFTYDPEKVWEGEDMDWMYGYGYRIAVQEPWGGWPSTLGEFPWPENGVVYWTAPDELGEYYFIVQDFYDEEWLGGLWVRVEETEASTHTVTFDLGGHGTRTGGGELVQTVTNGCAAVAPEVVAYAGWVFDGWDKDFGNVTADMTVSAQWKESVAIFETGWHGDGTNFWYGIKTNWVEKGVRCTITALSPVVDGLTHYVCTGCTMVSGGSEFEFPGTSLTTTPKAELEIYWNYEVDGYWFEATAGEHGRIECPAAGWVEPGSSVTIRSFPDEGYEFAGLSGDVEGCVVTNGMIVVPMDRGRRIRAEFTPNRPIAVIDAVSPESPLSSDCIVFSGHGERGMITAYQWQCRRTDGGASSAAVRTIGFAQAGYVKLDAGGWRLEFFVQNDQGVWSLAATHDLTVGEVPLAPDLQILRSDIALRDAYGRRVDNVAVGETIDISLAVRNVGDADVGGPVRVRLYEGILPVEALNGGSNAVAVAETSIPGVSAGRSSSVRMKWTVGKDAQGSDIAGYANGYRPYTVAVVSEDGTAEVTYVNNLASVMVALGDPGETVSELESRVVVPSSVYEGELIRIEVTASYALSDGRGSIGSVAAVGAEITFSVDGDIVKTGSVPAPDGRYVLWIESLPVGEHEIAVTVGDGTMTKSFTDVVAVRTRPSEPPDEPGPSVGPGPEPAAVPRLAVRSFALTGDGIYSSSHPHYTATLGGRVGLRAKIVNEGTADFTNAVTATVRLVPSDGDAAECVGLVIPNGLAAGESAWLEVGELDVVDVERDVRLTVLAGTAVSSPCTLHVRKDRPNLVVEQFALSPSAAVWGDEIVATVRVANRGRADCTTPFTVGVAGAECEVPGLEAGEAATRTLTFAVADVLGEPGTCTVIARADASGEVDESDRSDNSRNCTLTVYADAAQPAPISLKAEPYPVPGVPSVLTAEIRNDGGQPYAGGTAKFFVGGSSGSLLGEGTVGALARFGGKGAATCLWTPNASGRVQVTVVIEGREYSTFFTVGNPPANLRVTEADISLEPGEPRVGDEVRFRAMVRNLSATTAATNATVKFMVTDGSGAFDTLSVVPLAFLAPGDSAAVDAGAVYVARAGVHAVKVRVMDGSGKDADDRDNEAERSFGVGVPVAAVVSNDISCIVGDTVVLDGRGSTGAEEFVWTVEEAPVGVIARIVDDHSPAATFVPPMAGVYRLALTVSCDGVTGEKAYVTVNADRVRIVAAAQGGGRIEPAGEAVYLAGETPRYRFVHENGYRLDRVDVDGATVMGVGGDYKFAPLAGNHEIEAVFVRQEAEIDGEEYGKWHVGDVYERVIETPVDLGGGTQLVCRGWSVWHSNVTDVIASSTDDTIRFKIGDVGPYGVVVDWTTNYWLTVIAPTNGSVVGATNGWHAASEKFSLTAVADEDYEFVRWTGDVPDKDEEENPLTLEMTGVKCVGATFARVPIDIPRAVNAEGIEWCTSGDAEWFGEWNDCAADGLHDARSGRISDGGESILSAKVFGKGTLSFVWKSSTEAKYDAVRLEVDSVIIRQLSGKTDWQPISVDLQSGGEHIIRWIFSKNRSISEGVDAVWIDEVRWNGVCEPLPTEVSLAEALNFGCDLTWTSGGDAAWEAVRSEFSYEGDACAISGCIGDGEGSWIQTTVNGAGLVEFAWAVSSEEGYDWVEFIVDGETVRMATGETGWQNPSYVLGEGEHTLRWEFWKDEIDLEDVGGDCAVLDYVRWTPKPDVVDPRFAKVDVEEFYDWLRKYRQIGDVEQPVSAAELKVMAAAKADVVGMKDMTLLEEYIAGTDPTDQKSKFTVKIAMDADGQPVVTWEPALNGEGVRTGVRTYTVMGSNVLSNDPKDWTECGEGKEGGFQYFKVSVRMP